MRTASEIVNYLVRHYQERSGEVTDNLLPATIDDLVDQLGHFLKIRLQEDTPYKNVWDDFVDQPEENAADLAGVLEPFFEAQPAVRERVDGFMRKITAVEVEQSDHEHSKTGTESDLKSGPGGLISGEGRTSSILADKQTQKNPPAYLYGNERQNYESERQTPVPKPFMIGENAQVIFLPDEEVPFPRLLDYFSQLVDTSPDLDENSKQHIQEQLETVYLQLSGQRAYDEEELAQAIEEIWDEAPTYSDALIRSLQKNVDELILEARAFIVQLHTPLK